MRLGRVIAVAFVALGAVYGAWLGFGVQTTGDYGTFYRPATDALLSGHVGGFFGALPADGVGGSLLMQAPAALLAKVVVGSELSQFRFAALFCLLALGAVGLGLARTMRSEGASPLHRAAVIGVCVLSPVILDAIRYGHPEEALGAALCVAAVLLARGDRVSLAGAALGLALINKPWALLAIPPVLLAVPGRRLALAAIALSIAVVWTAVSYIASPAAFSHELHAANAILVAHPPDLWWPLAYLRSVRGVTPAYFVPSLVNDHARELAVFLALPLSLPLARRRQRSTEECLALLALLLVVRCMLDPTNHIYYQLPLVIALAAWEAQTGRAPVLALAATAGFWLVFHTISGTGSLTAQFVAYLAVTVPLAVVLLRLVLRGGIVPRRDRDRGRQPVPVVAAAGS